MFISILSFIKALTLDFLTGDRTRGETPTNVVSHVDFFFFLSLLNTIVSRLIPMTELVDQSRK